MTAGEIGAGASIAVAILAYGTILYNAGRYGEKQNNLTESLNKLKEEVEAITGHFVVRDVCLAEGRRRDEQIRELYRQHRELSQIVLKIQSKNGELNDNGS